MFFEGDRIDAMREMILAETLEARKAALAKLLPYQRDDFAGIFRALNGYPATIRFLDPPLHEFLPHTPEQQADLAKKLGVPVEKIHPRVEQLHEFNPMLGLRGCRLGIDFPEISEMQARAVFEAAAIVQKEGIKVRPEVMIPLVGFKKEFDLQLEIVHRVAKEVQAEKKVKLTYLVGTMIEVPRGALTADEIAQSAEFFSFGTNDLTQTGLGMSRDDSGSFLPHYAELEIVKKNPFATIDATGVGQLVEIAVTEGPERHEGPQARHLRRARRRSRLDPVLREGRPRLRQRVAVPRAGRAPRRGAGGDRAKARRRATGCSQESRLKFLAPASCMITIFVHRDGQTEPVTSIDRSWLSPAAGAYIWVDLAAPSIPESLVLSDTFAFHRSGRRGRPIARASRRRSTAYDGYFFAGRRGRLTLTSTSSSAAHYIVSVHWDESKAIADLIDSLRHRRQAIRRGAVRAVPPARRRARWTASRPPSRSWQAGAEAAEKRVLEKADAPMRCERC